MKLLWHQDLTNNSELKLTSQRVERGYKISAETLGIEEVGSVVRAGDNEMEMVQAVIMRLTRHWAIVAQGIADMAKHAMSAPPVKRHDCRKGSAINIDSIDQWFAAGCNRVQRSLHHCAAVASRSRSPRVGHQRPWRFVHRQNGCVAEAQKLEPGSPASILQPSGGGIIERSTRSEPI